MKKIGKLIAEAMEKVAKTVITAEEWQGIGTNLKLWKECSWTGVISRLYDHDSEKMEAVWMSPTFC